MRCYTKLRGAPSRRNRPMWAWKAGIGRIDENSQAAVGVIDLPDINAAFGRLFFWVACAGKVHQIRDQGGSASDLAAFLRMPI
jgi:hypothetical protein